MPFKESSLFILLHCPLAALVAACALSTSVAACTPTPTPASETSAPSKESTPEVYRRSQPMMGTRFEIQVVSADADRAGRAIDAAFAEIDRVESLISEWRPTSEISEVNRLGAARPVAVGPELFEVVRRGLELSAQTQGAFDITFAACGHLWSVGDEQIPTDEQIADCLPRIDHSAVTVDEDERTIALGNEHSQLGLGGIGKGYGVDRAARVLEARGIEDFVVDGGGDLRVKGRRIDRPWSVGVIHPRAPRELLGTVSISEGALVTSGDYERYFELDGTRYHHIIDPATGRPANRSVAVTVIAADATRADALATGLFVMGPREGIALAERLDDVEAMIVDPDLSIHKSSGFAHFFRPAASPVTPAPGGL